jgi:hypothetical protein
MFKRRGSFDNSVGDILCTRVMANRPGGDQVDFTTGGILEQAIEPRVLIAALCTADPCVLITASHFPFREPDPEPHLGDVDSEGATSRSPLSRLFLGIALGRSLRSERLTTPWSMQKESATSGTRPEHGSDNEKSPVFVGYSQARLLNDEKLSPDAELNVVRSH